MYKQHNYYNNISETMKKIGLQLLMTLLSLPLLARIQLTSLLIMYLLEKEISSFTLDTLGNFTITCKSMVVLVSGVARSKQQRNI